MPLEASSALEPDVICRQVGGQELAPMSGYWQTLFPSTSARIDGRVPTASSAPYLVTTRLNPQKELIAVAFIPESEDHVAKYNEFAEATRRQPSRAGKQDGGA